MNDEQYLAQSLDQLQTFAAGLALQGLRPVVAIYSTFLQRAIDQIIHDVALHSLPVIFCLDRAGLVGDDGPTHHGYFDLSYLRMIPNAVIMAPRDEAELCHMLKTAVEYKNGPVFVRYPRGTATGVCLPAELQSLPIGEPEPLSEGKDVLLMAAGINRYVEKRTGPVLKHFLLLRQQHH